MERRPIKAQPDIWKRLAHLAIDLDESAEKLAGMILAEVLPTIESDVRSGKRKPRAKR